MRLSVIVTLALLCGCIMAAEQEQEATYQIDDALDLLLDLRDDTAQSLYTLEENWRFNKEALQGEEKSLQDLIASKESQCAADEAHRDQTQKDLNDTNEYIEWLEQQIKESTENLNELLIRRCELNKQFIDHIKREKIAMSLLEFIRIAIEKKDTFDFIQMKKFNRNFASFLQAYHNNDINQILLLQQDFVDENDYNVDVDFSTHDRTEEEIGSGHVDNEKGKISLDDFTNGRRRNWQIYKAELLELLNELKAKISLKIKAAIDDEIAASVALANYKNNTLRNIEKYEKELVKARKQAIDLADQLNEDNAKLSKCREDEAELKIQLNQILHEIEIRQAEFDKKHNDLQEQVHLFNEIIAEYQNSIFSEGDDFKGRTEDYFDNQTFDNDSNYTGREIPDIDFMTGF